jgi:hypothetical protein
MKDQRPDDREVERIRELLEKAAPRNPQTAGRAAAVAQRAHRSRTTRGVLSGVAVAAVAVTVIVGPHFLKSSPTTNDATDPTNGAEPTSDVDPFANPCPELPIDVTGVEDSVQLSADVVSVRLCSAVLPHLRDQRAKQDVVSSWVPPNDALVTDVDVFIDALGSAPGFHASDCAALFPVLDPFAVQFTAVDGEVMTVGAAEPLCSGISLDRGRTVSGTTLLGLFSKAIEAQRRALDPPESVPALTQRDCTDLSASRSTNGLGSSLGGMVSGVACFTTVPEPFAGEYEGGGSAVQYDFATLSASDIAAIVADLARNTTEQRTEPFGCIDYGPQTVIVLRNAWGDRSSWMTEPCSDEYSGPGGFWVPSAATRTLIETALQS